MRKNIYEFDWSGADTHARMQPTKALYRILRKLHQTQIGGVFDDLFEQAQGVPLSGGSDPYSNIKRGQYDRVKAQAIHEWLANHHFEFAQSEAPELFQIPRHSPWERFITDHHKEGGLSVVLLDQMGIASRKHAQDGATTLRIGQAFAFELTADKPAHVLAFEQYADQWHGIPLGDDERIMRVEVDAGRTLLPRNADGSPIPLWEHDDTGPHRFVFVLCHGRKPNTDQASLIDYGKLYRVVVAEAHTRVMT